MKLVLEIDNMEVVDWLIDSSNQCYDAGMTMGKGAILSGSVGKKSNIVQNRVIFYCGIPSRVILSGSSGVTERHSIVKLCYADPLGKARGNQSSPHNPIIG